MQSRWLRLLFGREYQLMDLLMLWDALFAEGDHLELTHYIVVAMLIAIKDIRKIFVQIFRPNCRPIVNILSQFQ